jgi:outer membrane protein assembly factor BamB
LSPAAEALSRRRLLVALAASALPGLLRAEGTTSERAAGPIVVRQWDSGNALLAPLTVEGSSVLYAGNSHLGRIDPTKQQALWRTAHGLSREAVFRPRAAGNLVLCGGLAELGAWNIDNGARSWVHTARTQLGVPCVTQALSYVGDGHELLALDNASGAVRWRYAGTPDTLTSYAPVVSGDTLMFAPGNGLLYALDAGQGRLKWRLDRSHEWQYLRQLYVSGEVLVAGSYKELLYGISVADGRVLWTFNAGNFINSHHVAGDAAYLWSPTGWVYAIDTQTGGVRWRHRTTNYRSAGANWGPLMAELVTQGEHLYALDMLGVLHVLHRQTGDEVHRLTLANDLRPTVLPLANRQIVVASGAGQVQLIRW